MHTREGLIVALAEGRSASANIVIVKRYTLRYSRTVVDPPTVWAARTPESAARADSAARALERPAPGFSACREC